MYIPEPLRRLNSRSIVYLDNSHFTLDASGVAGFFGGEEAASAMATVHICKYRKYLGWYNSPGSYEIAKRYGHLTKFSFVFGRGHASDPEELLALLGLYGRKGPKFLRVHSGHIIPETNHLAEAFVKAYSSPEYFMKPPSGSSPHQRQPVSVTIVGLDECPENGIALEPSHTPQNSLIYATVPIIVSAVTCAMCAVVADWYSSSLILLGIIVNGVSCLAIGSVELRFIRPLLIGKSDQQQPSHSSVRKHRISGIFITPTNVILLEGPEDTAMAVALGKFVPAFSSRKSFHNYIGFSSIILLLQFIAQLLLIPQGSLFGQIMFVTSLGVSWIYNLGLCSLDMMRVQQRTLLKPILKLEDTDKLPLYRLGNWPAMVTFVLLVLKLEDDKINKHDSGLHTVLDVLVEGSDSIWKIWKSVILQEVQKLGRSESSISVKDLDIRSVESLREEDAMLLRELSEEDISMLDKHLDEARWGLEEYKIERAQCSV